MNAGSVKIDRILLTIILGLAFLPAAAQESFQDRYIQRWVALEDGLPCNYVDDVCTDRFGFLWIATSGGGLCRYDGYGLITLNMATEPSLKSNFTRNLLADGFDRLWIGSEGGLDVLDLRTHEKLDLDLGIPEDDGGVLCSYLTQDATGAVWTKFGTTLYRFSFEADGSVAHTATFTDGRLSPANFVFQDVDGDGSVWCSLGGRLHKVSESALGVLEAAPVRTALDLGENTYLSDFLPAGQQVWISSENGLFQLHRQTGEFKHYASDPSNPRSLTQNFVTGLTQTTDGLLLCSTLRGYNVYNPVTDNFERVGADVVNCIQQTDGYLLVGTETQGLLVLSRKYLDIRHFTHIPNDRGSLPDGAVNAVFQQENGRLWVGTVEGGLSIREPGADRFSHLTRERGLSHNSVSAFAQGEQSFLYVGTWGGGVDIVSANPPYRVLGHLPALDTRAEYIGALEFDTRNQLLWVCSNQGIFLYNPADRTYRSALEGGAATGCIGSCIDRRGFLWVGCQEGLYVFDLNARKADGTFPFSHYRYKLDAPGTRADEKICAIREVSDSVLYLASNGSGIYRAKLLKDGINFVFTCYNSRQGLSNDRARGICADARGRIWISTEHGLNMLDPVTGVVVPFLEQDGVQYTQFHWNNACQGTDGLLYFGHMHGLSVVDPSQYVSQTEVAPLRFTRTEVGNRVLMDPELGLLKLHQKDRSILFQFASLQAGAASGNIRYQYRLEGYDEQWQTVPPGRHEALYSSLPSGTHRFQVRALSRTGMVTGTLDSLLDVQPFFYYTWWFALLLGLFLLGVVWLIIRIRTRSILSRQEELEQMVEQRTQEISAQKRLVEQQADELLRQNDVLRRQNEELVSRKMLSVEQENPFKKKTLDALRSHYKNPDLDVAGFCQAMGMSKTLLNTRLQEAFGQSVSQLIRTYRLTLAREMLESGSGYTVAEVAYETGFNDPKYFTRCFAKEFGITPSSLGRE